MKTNILGEGTFSRVVQHPGKGMRDAVYKKRKFLLNEDEFRRFTQDHEEYISALNSVGVVMPRTKIMGKKEGDGMMRAFLRQDYVHGRNLEEHLRGPDSAKFFRQLVDRSLAVLKRPGLGIDCKPENWVVDQRGNLIFLDVSPPLLKPLQPYDNKVVTELYKLRFPMTIIRPQLRRRIFASLEGILSRLLAFSELLNPQMKPEFERIAREKLKERGGSIAKFKVLYHAWSVREARTRLKIRFAYQ